MKEMKDSGIRWIGEIPSHWIRSKIKNICSTIGSGTTPNSYAADYYNGEIYWIQSGDIYKKSEINDTSTKVTELALREISTLKIYEAPFIVMAMYGSVGSIAISNINACSNQACCCIKPNSNVTLRFLYYWLVSCEQDFLMKAEGSSQQNISQFKIKNQIIFLPSIKEQKLITSFLDCKCSIIEYILVEIKREINILEEYRQSVIYRAVMRGLNPNAEIKDSGVPWVGMIPASWNVMPAKFVVDVCHGSDPKTEGDVPVYGSGSAPVKTCGEWKEGPSVLVGRKGTISIPKYIEGKFWNVDTAFNVFSKKINIKYYFYLATCFNYDFYATQTTVPSMTQFDYGSMKIPIPSSSEQQAIADYLDAECARIDAVISDKQKQIAALEEYRKSLIYNAVTGKMEVPAS